MIHSLQERVAWSAEGKRRMRKKKKNKLFYTNGRNRSKCRLLFQIEPSFVPSSTFKQTRHLFKLGHTTIAAGIALTGSSCSPTSELVEHLLEFLATLQIKGRPAMPGTQRQQHRENQAVCIDRIIQSSQWV
jgi:hypothetical protein